jgi:hypothetical protein
MPRLKSRTSQIPEGFFYYHPETKWRSTPWASFDSIVNEVIQHRMGNPALAMKHRWSTDRAQVEAEVDAFNANVCAQMGWQQFIVGNEGVPPPKMKAPSAAEVSQLSAVATKVRLVWAGIKNLSEWLDAGAPAVEQTRAELRAHVCVNCPLHGQGDFSAWFTKPAAEAIKRQVEKGLEKNLSTSYDSKLGVCNACLCPMRLKVHEPIEIILNHTSPETLDKLRTAPACWIISEMAKA